MIVVEGRGADAKVVVCWPAVEVTVGLETVCAAVMVVVDVRVVA